MVTLRQQLEMERKRAALLENQLFALRSAQLSKDDWEPNVHGYLGGSSLMHEVDDHDYKMSTETTGGESVLSGDCAEGAAPGHAMISAVDHSPTPPLPGRYSTSPLSPVVRRTRH